MTTTYCDGLKFKRLLVAGSRWLSQHRRVLNDLNVFPVPDGDTGTNMSLTLRGALSKLLTKKAHLNLAEVAQLAAHGALLGARGNSGVILSQILLGLAQGFAGQENIDTVTLAAALQNARRCAYASVQNPREGTILTVIASVADKATEVAPTTKSLEDLLENLAMAARTSLVESKDLLPILKEAGVVDSGGLGLVYIIEGMLKAAQGSLTVLSEESSAEDSEWLENHGDLKKLPQESALEKDIQYGFCTEFLVQGTTLRPEDVRPQLEKLGDSLVLARTGDLLKVHIHTNNPDLVEMLVTPGAVSFKRKVEDMRIQNQQRRTQSSSSSCQQDNPQASAPNTLLPGELRIVEPPAGKKNVRQLVPVAAVANGEGLLEYLQSWSIKTIHGGQTLNPSTDDFLSAMRQAAQEAQNFNGDTTAGPVLVFPNNSNCVAAAQQAAELFEGEAAVIPGQSPAQLVALLNTPRLISDSTRPHLCVDCSLPPCGEITQAVKDAQIMGLDIRCGDFLALWQGRALDCSLKLEEALFSLLRQAGASDKSRLILIAGEDCDPDEIEQLLMQIQEHFIHLNVEFLWGGQPHHRLLLAME